MLRTFNPLLHWQDTGHNLPWSGSCHRLEPLWRRPVLLCHARWYTIRWCSFAFNIVIQNTVEFGSVGIFWLLSKAPSTIDTRRVITDKERDLLQPACVRLHKILLQCVRTLPCRKRIIDQRSMIQILGCCHLPTVVNAVYLSIACYSHHKF